jgi:hypothetical protein
MAKSPARRNDGQIHKCATPNISQNSLEGFYFTASKHLTRLIYCPKVSLLSCKFSSIPPIIASFGSSSYENIHSFRIQFHINIREKGRESYLHTMVDYFNRSLTVIFHGQLERRSA